MSARYNQRLIRTPRVPAAAAIVTASPTDNDPLRPAAGNDSRDENWHAMPSSEVAERLESGADGLDDSEARARRHRYGPNRLHRAKRRGPLLRFLMQFNNILLYVMMGAAVITALLEHWVDTFVLLGAVIINAIIGFLQEGKAENALDAIRSMLSPRTTVMRGGHRREIDAVDLVPGDLVLVASGDRVPADIRLVTVKSLRVDEAALTGESQAASKSVDAVAANAALGDRRSMIYSGTVVVYGQGRASSSPPVRTPSSGASIACCPTSRPSPPPCCVRSIASAGHWPW